MAGPVGGTSDYGSPASTVSSSTVSSPSSVGAWDDYDEEYTTETRRSPSTSELYVFIVTSVVLLFFAYESGRDSFSRDDGWRYVTALGVAYLISRGLAKAGAYESYFRGRRDRR